MDDNPEVFRFQNLDSTNTRLKEIITRQNTPEFSVVITPHQTAGRGQIGSSWASEKDKNLTFSIVLYPGFLEIENQFSLTQVVTTAITDVIGQLIPTPSIKWPNDIYWGDKKLAGILVENSLAGNTISSTIVGIGLNVNQEVFPPSVPNPVSLKMLTAKSHDVETLFLQIRQALISRYIQLVKDGIKNIKSDYLRQLYRSGDFYKFKDYRGFFLARIQGVSESGHLLLTDSSGTVRSYAFKEVSYVI